MTTKPKDLPSNCMSVAEVAKYLGVVELTVRNLIDRKQLRASKAGRRVIITPAAVQEFLDDNPA